MKTEKRKIGSWEFAFSPTVYELTPEALNEAGTLIKAWQPVFPKENTWAQQHFGIPSLFIRLDCVVNGTVKIFEIEERPAGMGTMNELHPGFKQRLKKAQQDWPLIKLLVSPKRAGQDDYLWVEETSPEEARQSTDCLLIRAEPEEIIFHEFETRSVSSLKRKGDKSYGLPMGLWEEVTVNDLPRLDWSKGFCLKEKQTSKTRGIEIWHPRKNQLSSQGIGGVSTRTRIENILKEKGSMYYQPFIEPMESPVGQPMIFRIFFFYDFDKLEYVYAGGFWNSRPNLKIHGATDAVVGLVE
ncbi:MAG: hypothetical protein WC523_01700 [Patescibacteria group bacterium]